MVLGIAGNGMIVREVLTFLHEIHFDKIVICGRPQSREKLEDLAATYQLDQVFTDYDAMLASDVDVVYVAVPNDLHGQYAKQALQAGKHVICEKPIVTSLQELEALEDLAKQQGVMLLEAMSIYHMPAFLQLQQDIERIGELRMCVFNYSQMSSRYGKFHAGEALPPVFDPAHAGGALRDLNVYNLAAMVGLFGAPKKTTYVANLERGIDTSGIVTADYGDFKAVCVGAKDCAAFGPSTIQGVEGTITITPYVNGMTGYDIRFVDASKDGVHVDLADGKHRLYYEFMEFKRIIEEQDVAACEGILAYSKQVVRIIEDGAVC